MSDPERELLLGRIAALENELRDVHAELNRVVAALRNVRILQERREVSPNRASMQTTIHDGILRSVADYRRIGDGS